MSIYVIQICKGCTNEFKTGAYEVKRGVQYCCRDCYNETKLRKRLIHDEICRAMEGKT